MSICGVDVVQSNVENETWNETYVYEYYTDDEYSISDYTEYTVSIVMVKWVWPLVILAGTVGNILSFMVLIRRRMRRTPVYFYLAMLACADTCALYLSGFKTWLRVLAGIELLHLSNAMCKLFMFLFLQSLHCSAVFIVAVTLDRFLTLWGVSTKSNFCVIRRAKVTSLVFFLVLAVYNIHVFWTIGLHDYGGFKLCNPLYDNSFMCDIFPWLKLSLYTIVPFILVFTLNLAIIVKVFQTQAQFSQEESRTTRLKASQQRVTIMLLGVSVSWLALTAPFTLYSFIGKSSAATTSHDEAKGFLYKTICFTLLYTNHAINFYLYCLTGRRFRRELCEVVQSLRCCGSRSKRSSSYTVRLVTPREPNRAGQKWIVGSGDIRLTAPALAPARDTTTPTSQRHS